MPGNARLSPSISQIDLDFVEREATPRLLMKLSFQPILLVSRFQILFIFSNYSVLNGHDQPSTTGLIKTIHSQNLGKVRITSRLMRPWSDSTISSIGCTPLSIPDRTIYCIHSLSRLKQGYCEFVLPEYPWETRRHRRRVSCRWWPVAELRLSTTQTWF